MSLLKAHFLVEKFLFPSNIFKKSQFIEDNITRRELKEASDPNKKTLETFVIYMQSRGYDRANAYIYSRVLTKACQEILSALAHQIKPGISVSTELAIKQSYINLTTTRGDNNNENSSFSSGFLPYAFDFPRLVQAETLAACTAKCSFCPYDSLARKGEKMSWFLLKKLALEFSKFPNDYNFSFMPFKVSDPFLDDRLPQIADLILNSHPLVKFSLTTNGFYMPKDVIDQLLAVSQKHPGRISISISLNTVNPEEYKDLMKLDIRRTINNLNYIRDKKNDFISKGIEEVSITRISTDYVGDVQFRKFAGGYSDPSIGKQFFNFEIHNLNGWINHDAGNYSTKNVDVSVASLFPCEEWQRISLLPNGDFSLCCMSHEASEDKLNFNHYTLKEMHKIKIKKYVPLSKNGQSMLGRKFSVSPCNNCDFTKRSPVHDAFGLLVRQPLDMK